MYGLSARDGQAVCVKCFDGSEIDFGVVVAALQKLFHLLDGGLTGVGTRAGVADGVHGDVMEPGEEHFLGNEALLDRIAVRAVVLDAVRDIEIVVHLAQIGDERCDLFVVGGVPAKVLKINS